MTVKCVLCTERGVIHVLLKKNNEVSLYLENEISSF